MIHFLKNFAMAGGLLQFVAYGAGRISVDNRIATRGGSVGVDRIRAVEA
jgi:putative oxidoreductase